MNTIYLKTALSAFAPEYNTVVEKLLDEKISGKSSIAAKDADDRKAWKMIRQKYLNGAVNQLDAAQIIMGLSELKGMMNSAPSLQSLGTFAVTGGCLNKIIELVKKDIDEHGTMEKADPADDVPVEDVPEAAPASGKKKKGFLFWRK